MFAVAGWTVLLLVILLNSAGALAIDIKPEIYLAPARSFWLFLQPWQSSPQLGWPSFNVGLAPVPGALAVLQLTGLSPDLSMRVVRVLLYTAGAVGIARLTKSVLRRPDVGWPGLVAAFAFVANPYSVVGAATLAILLPMALLPWMCLGFLAALRHPRAWRWPALAALAFAGMSGMNAGVVPLLQLMALPFVVWIARRVDSVRWRAVVGASVRTGVLLVLASAYWLVPSIIAAAQGVTVLDNSETLEGISSTTSLAEVLRGLGLWPMYGSGLSGPWQPGFISYLTSAPVLVGSFGVVLVLVLAALMARGPARLPLVAMVFTAAVLMVGVYPWAHPSPVGWALRWMFENVPVTGAFRTLNKAGAVLVLGGALLCGLAVDRWSPRAWSIPRKGAALGALLAVGLAAVWPALSGGLYPRLLPLPAYWTQAGQDLSRGDQAHRVWFVPGEVQADYSWTTSQPDDLALPLVSRPTVLRTTLPIASPHASNLLAAVDTDLQKGQLLPGSLSAVARYLAVDRVLVRNDTRWYESFGARPWTVHTQVAPDQGLGAPETWGRAGENIVARDAGAVADAERTLPPLESYPVTAPEQIVRAESTRGLVLIAGDGFSVAPLATNGILDKGQTFRYLSDIEPATFRDLLGPQRRIELTDTNRRRSTVLGWLAGNQGPLLPEGATPVSTRALGGPDDQTVLQVRGGASVSATQVGSSFGDLPEAVAENAFDGDPRTSWQFGDFGTAVGQSITLTLDAPIAVSEVRFTPAVIGPLGISRVRVTIGETSVDADVAADGSTIISVPTTSATEFTLSVLATKGVGVNRVGVSEIGLGAVQLTRVARLPLTLSHLASTLDDGGRRALASTPLDVVLRRETGAPGQFSDEELSLQRTFTLPDVRTYRTYGLLSVPLDETEAEADLLAGVDPAVTVRSSSHIGSVGESRGSFALDGNPATAWIATGFGPRESVIVTGPEQRLDHVDVTQLSKTGGADLTAWATRVQVSVNGVVVGSGTVAPGTSTVSFPAQRATSVRVKILDREGGLSGVRLSELGVGRWSAAPSAERAASVCVSLGTLDGRPFEAHLVGASRPGSQALFGGCQDAVTTLGPTTHDLVGSPRWVVDRLTLRDIGGETVVAPGPVPVLQWSTGFGPTYDIKTGSATEPYFLVLASSFDARWTADGAAAEPVDGFANSWLMGAGGPRSIGLGFGSARPSVAAMGVSTLSVAVLAGLAVARPRQLVAGPTSPTGLSPASCGDQAVAPRRRPRRTAWALLAVGAGLALGVWALAAAIVLVMWHAVRQPRLRVLVCCACVLAAAIPVVWLVGEPSSAVSPTPQMVSDNLLPHEVATVLVVVVAVVVLRLEGLLAGRAGRFRTARESEGDDDD